MKNFIYISTNLINGKQYVGSHLGTQNDSYLGSGVYLIKAVKKYGNENFKREILEECDPKNNLILEEKYIKKYNTLSPNGYNISPTGGHNVKGCFSEESIKKIKSSLQGKVRKPLSEETKRKISFRNKGEKNGFYRKSHTIEQRNKWSKERKGIEFSDDHKKHLSESLSNENNPMFGKRGKNSPNFGSKRTIESRIKMRGRVKTKEERKKISEHNRSRPKIKCEYCGKLLDNMNYKRWHGYNCKNKLDKND
jgi:group I intron endonuclease